MLVPAIGGYAGCSQTRAMEYKLITRATPREREKPKRFYAIPVNKGKHTLKEITVDIAHRTSLTPKNVKTVLTTLVDILPEMLQAGWSVQLGDFGTLRLNIDSEGAAEVEEFTADHINGVKIIFTPSMKIRKTLRETTFEPEKEATKQS